MPQRCGSSVSPFVFHSRRCSRRSSSRAVRSAGCTETEMLSVQAQKQLGEFALDARFASESGVTALFGPSGTGKTTIIMLIAGLMRPDRGTIALGGDVLFDAEKRIDVKPWKRRIGTVFQEARLFPHLSVRHNLNYGR